MTPDTQQFVIRWGFVGLLAATLTSLIALGVLAVIHDGTLADQMVGLYQQIVQQGIYAIAALLGLHTLLAPVITAVQNKQQQPYIPPVAIPPVATPPAATPPAGPPVMGA